jgi:hypothetical protein
VENILEVSGGNAQEVAAAQGFILLCELTLITREMVIITYNLASITTMKLLENCGSMRSALIAGKICSWSGKETINPATPATFQGKVALPWNSL